MSSSYLVQVRHSTTNEPLLAKGELPLPSAYEDNAELLCRQTETQTCFGSSALSAFLAAMASPRFDALTARTVAGSYNLYDQQRVCCTAEVKGQASRCGGHAWDPISGRTEDLPFLADRNPDHFIDITTGKKTSHWFMSRRRVARDPKNTTGNPLDSRDTKDSLLSGNDPPRGQELS